MCIIGQFIRTNMLKQLYFETKPQHRSSRVPSYCRIVMNYHLTAARHSISIAVIMTVNGAIRMRIIMAPLVLKEKGWD